MKISTNVQEKDIFHRARLAGRQVGDWLLCALAGAIVALALLWPLLRF